MDKVSGKVFTKIQKEKITPVPRWKFLLKNDVIWLFFTISIIVGSLSFGIILFMISVHEWDIYKYLNKTFFEHLMVSLPYLWLLFLVFFIILANYNFKHTKSGYRQKAYVILLFSVILSFIFGFSIYYLGFSEKINEAFSENVPYYKPLFYNKEESWKEEKNGLLGGKIIEVKDARDFSLRDFENETWQVDAKDAVLERKSIIRKGRKVKIIGEIKEDHVFIAKEIRSWTCCTIKEDYETKKDQEHKESVQENETTEH